MVSRQISVSRAVSFAEMANRSDATVHKPISLLQLAPLRQRMDRLTAGGDEGEEPYVVRVDNDASIPRDSVHLGEAVDIANKVARVLFHRAT